jgi:hypothetical protein
MTARQREAVLAALRRRHRRRTEALLIALRIADRGVRS